ncbi:MAG: ABC transporter permease [Bryobacteraceae bacterium]
MNWWHRLLKRNELERKLDAELRFHFDRQVADNIRRGMSEAEARRSARLKFGGLEEVKEDCREARGTLWVESTLQDLRLALRGLRRSPGFTLTALCTLALGIGANTAIFTLIDAFLLRTLPVHDPQSLAQIHIKGGAGFGISNNENNLSYAVWDQLRRHQQGFSGVFAWAKAETFAIGSGATERQAHGLWISGPMFSTLGIAPVRGHFFTLSDERPGCGIPGAVLSYGFWQSEFGARDSAIGSTLIINGHPTQIIGVTPPRFSGLEAGDKFDIAVPLCSMTSYSPSAEALRRSDFSFLNVMGRLKPGWTLAQAASQLASISPAIFEATVPTGYDSTAHTFYKKLRLSAYPAATGVNTMGESDKASLWLLLAITGLVLLIACANLANLMLVRATTREREMAVRAAIGASRFRLIRQLFAEGLVIAILGAALGLSVANVLAKGILLLVTTSDYTPYVDLSPDWRILAFTAAGTVVTCLIFGLVPAFRGSQTDPGEALKAGTRGMTGGRQRASLQNTLVVSQIAISLVLLVGAALFVQSFWNLITLNPGFREEGIILASVDFSHVSMPVDRHMPFLQNLLEQIRSVPQVESAATSTHPPLNGSSWTLGVRAGPVNSSSKFTWISPDYFRTMGTPMLAGRDFTARDTATSAPVAIVNQTFVREILKGADPIGQTILTRAEPNYPATLYEIVGVVGDTKYAGLRETIPPQAFAPALQFNPGAGGPGGNVFIRSSAKPESVIAAVRQKLAEVSPNIRSAFEIFETNVRNGLIMERLMAILSGFFGALAALLAAIGLYGVTSYAVSARTNEIGIRLALGATSRAVTRSIVRRASYLVILGAAVGVILAAAMARYASSLLFGLRYNDPATFLAASTFLLIIAVLASWVPAHRASRLDPMAALRYE